MRISDWSSDVCSSDLRPAHSVGHDRLHRKQSAVFVLARFMLLSHKKHSAHCTCACPHKRHKHSTYPHVILASTTTAQGGCISPVATSLTRSYLLKTSSFISQTRCPLQCAPATLGLSSS